jgi:PAS domain S-box-containing protein
LIGVAVFAAIAVLTQLLTYQQYLLFEKSEFEKISLEANAIGDKLKTSLSNSLSATRTLAFMVEKYGEPREFDSIAKHILESNKFIDAMQLTRRGVITHIYPLEGNQAVIGYDVLADSLRSQEALKALEKKTLYFAGPFELRQGGTAVVGRLPIFRDNSFWGFSVVLIKFSTLLEAAGISMLPEKKFTYQLSKRNPSTGEEEFFLPGPVPSSEHSVSVEVPDGEWKLYVLPKDRPGFFLHVIPFSFLGILLSVTAGLFGWHFARQPEKLKKRIHEVTTEMNAYQKAATQSLERVNRLFHFTSRINHVMVHVTNEEDMYSQVCQIAIDVGKFKLGWIGLIDEVAQKIFVAGSSGNDSGYLAEITPISVTSEDIEGPAMRMIRTGTFVYCNDIATDPLMKPWAKTALDRGYRSSILLPIRKSGKVIGSFNIYSDEPYCFDERETQLLVETTDNISFALDNFERERQRRQAEQQIQSEKMLSDSIINSLPGIFYLYNQDGKFFRWNRNFEIVSGYHANEVSLMHPLDFFKGNNKILLKDKISTVFHSGYADVLANFYTKDHREIPYYFNGRKVTFNGIDYLIGMGLDVSDRVKTETALLERTEEIEKLSAHLQNVREEERSRIALEIHDVLGQQLTALKMDATWLRKKAPDESVVTERFATMIALIDDTIKTVRRISSELRPGILDDLGLVAALEWQGTEFEKNTGITLQFETNWNDVGLERNFSTAIFRVYQEALTNIARHANASQINTMFVHHDEFIELIIRDNGRGIDFSEVKNKKSLGLIGMKERARLFGGEICIENSIPHGTIVTLRIPLLKSNLISV